MRKEFLFFAVLFVVSIILIQTILIISIFISPNNSHLAKGELTAQSQGLFSACFGRSVEIDFSDCPTILNQSTRIENNSKSCILFTNFVNDSSFVFIEQNYINNGVVYNVRENGTLTITGFQQATFQPSHPSYAPEYHDIRVGVYNHNLVEDCFFDTSDFFQVKFLDINDPPEFIPAVPIFNISLMNGQSIVRFIGDSFKDIDFREEWNSPLNYTYYVAGGKNSKIIRNMDGPYLELGTEEDQCPPTEYVFFEAIDPEGLVSDPSNLIEIKVECSAPEESVGSGGGLPEICISKYDCKDWTECFVNGTQKRVCNDVLCGEEQKVFWRECDYSVEEEKKEELIEEVVATCTDGIRNCHKMEDGSFICEEGIDCGGPCSVCKRIESPGLLIEKTANKIIYFFAFLIVSFTTLVMVYIFFRKQILSFLARIGWWFTRKKRKQILLIDDDKEHLLQEINKLYSDIFNSSETIFVRKHDYLINAINFSREYVCSILKLNETFNFEDVKLSLNKIVYNDSLRKGISLYSQSIFKNERKSTILSKQELLNFVQETRMLVLNSSKLIKTDFNFKALELDIKGSSLEKAQIIIHNSFLALCFSEVVSAKNNYYDLLKLYDELSEIDKIKIYYELSKIYNYTKTIISWH